MIICYGSPRKLTQDHFHPWQGQHFISSRVDIYYGYSLPFLPLQDFGQHSWRLKETDQHRTKNTTNTVLDEGLDFTAVHSVHGICESYHKIHSPEYTGLVEKLNGLLKVQLRHELEVDTYKWWNAIFQTIFLWVVGLEFLFLRWGVNHYKTNSWSSIQLSTMATAQFLKTSCVTRIADKKKKKNQL